MKSIIAMKFLVATFLVAVVTQANAGEVTEAMVLKANPKQVFLGRLSACNKHDVDKFFSFYAEAYRSVFSKNKSLKKSVYGHDCGNFPTVSDGEMAALTKGIKIFVKKTNQKSIFTQQPIFILCSTTKDTKYCSENGLWDFPVILENGQVKFVTD